MWNYKENIEKDGCAWNEHIDAKCCNFTCMVISALVVTILASFQSSFPVEHFLTSWKGGTCLERTVLWIFRPVKTGYWLVNLAHIMKWDSAFVLCARLLFSFAVSPPFEYHPLQMLCVPVDILRFCFPLHSHISIFCATFIINTTLASTHHLSAGHLP